MVLPHVPIRLNSGRKAIHEIQKIKSNFYVIYMVKRRS